MPEKIWFWEVHTGTSTPALARLMKAVVVTRSKITSTHCLGISMGFDLGRGIAMDAMVGVPDGSQDLFKEIAKPYDMRPNSQLQIGLTAPAYDGHPGRER